MTALFQDLVGSRALNQTLGNKKEFPMNLGFVLALAFGIGLVAGLIRFDEVE